MIEPFKRAAPKLSKVLLSLGILLMPLLPGLLTACSPKALPADPAPAGPATESSWSGDFKIKGEATPLTVVLVRPMDQDRDEVRARLLILSAFGASLGDCRLAGERADCRNAAPALAPINQKIALAFSRLLKSGHWPPAETAALSGPDWRAETGPGSFEYFSRETPAWELKLRKAAAGK